MAPATQHAVGGLIRKSSRTILVVEDEVMIRMLLIEFLQDHGYTVLEAGTVREAKTILGTGSPIDLVFSDINMPGGETGFTLSKWVNRHFPDTKVLLTSGAPHPYEDTKDLQEPLIQKPYSWNSLLQRIQRQIERSEAALAETCAG